MVTQPVIDPNAVYESAVTERFVRNPGDASFAALFEVFSPQLLAFFRTRVRELSVAEDLAQDVMLTVYRAGQVRDRALFRAWLFKIAKNALCRHYGRSAAELQTV